MQKIVCLQELKYFPPPIYLLTTSMLCTCYASERVLQTQLSNFQFRAFASEMSSARKQYQDVGRVKRFLLTYLLFVSLCRVVMSSVYVCRRPINLPRMSVAAANDNPSTYRAGSAVICRFSRRCWRFIATSQSHDCCHHVIGFRRLVRSAV